MSQPQSIELVPGRSIGEVRLGAKVGDLPPRTRMSAPAGELDEVHFVVNEAGEVNDIWIEDIRSVSREIWFQGKVIPPGASIEELSVFFGKCEQVPGIKGGIFYNCAVGMALGTDFTRRTLQIRVKPISKEAGP